MKKFISIILLIVILIFAIYNVVLANPIDAMAGYEDDANSSKLNNIGSKLYGIVLIVGSAVAVGMLAIMAIKFMTSEAQEKAQVKKNLLGFTIGVIILLCVIGLLGIFKSVGEQISTQSTVQWF